MDTGDKKFFAPVLRDYNNNIERRWRVEYWEPTHNRQGYKRTVIYGDINKATTVEARHERAVDLIKTLKFDQPGEDTMLTKVIEVGRLEWRKKTISTYKTVKTKYEAYLDGKPAENATELTINGFLRSAQDKGANVGTLFKYRYILFSLYERAKGMKLCSANPVIKIAQGGREPQSLAYFSTRQVTLIKEEIFGTQLWLAVRLLFYCFIRPGEQRGLKISDINFEMGYIEIRAEISKNKKTQKVAIPAHFLEEIEYLKHYANNFYVLGSRGIPGPKQIPVNLLSKEHRAVLQKLEIRGNYAFYSWKHTGAVRCVQAGLNIRDIQNQLRHHSLDMVQEYLKGLGVLQSVDLKNKYPKL